MTSRIERHAGLVVVVVGILLLSALGITLAVSSHFSPTRTSPNPTTSPPPPPNPPPPVPPPPAILISGGPFAWTNISASVGHTPACRDSPGLVYDVALEEVVMFGGVSQCGQANSFSLGDTWTFSNGTWTNITGTVGVAPSPRWGMAMVYDPTAGQVVLFGGTDTYGFANNETWEFNGTWHDLTSTQITSPPLGFGAGATYDPNAGGVLLYGGQSGFS
ncbi:MAG: hypothetical protein L3K10_01000, partial [Thermoplasmata archaeon]|nr:hypothetical protein [Thermoplasmata archaeon]